MSVYMAPAELIIESSKKASVDRISHLPSEVRGHILQFLPLKEAIRTRILSTHWRHQRAPRPQLLLDQPFVSKLSRPQISYYLNTVCSILRNHFGPLQKFALYFPDGFSTNTDIISPWFRFLSGKFVQEFSLIQEEGCLNMEVPVSMFSSATLNSLLTQLTLVKFGLPSDLHLPLGFPSLISLQLHMPFYSAHNKQANLAEILISKCPLLESLDLKLSENEINGVCIRASRLQNLVLHGYFGWICLQETKQVKTLSLTMSLGCQCPHELWELLICVSHIEKLLLGRSFWKLCNLQWFREIAYCDTQKLRLPIKLRQLQHLVLDNVPLIYRAIVSFMLSLLQSAPQLQKLEINVGSYRIGEAIMIDKHVCCLQHLKFAKLSCLWHASLSLFSVGKLILASSPVLEALTIEAEVKVDEDIWLKEKLSQCHRASANVKITISTTICAGMTLEEFNNLKRRF